MTREEAIMYWEDFLGEIDQMEVDDCWTNEDAETQREATKMAISALRQQEHFREVTKKAEPLTLDELRKMDGYPVWLEFPNDGDGRWDLIAFCNSEFLSTYRSGYLLLEEYGKTWLAYRHKPEEGTV